MKPIINTKPMIALVLLSTAAFQAQAELNNGDTLRFGTGSKVSLEVSPGFWVDAAIAAGTGLIIGEAQTDHSIDAPFHLFEQTTRHLSSEPVAVMDADVSSAVLDFSSWAMTWHGVVIPLGAGGSDEQGDGVAVVQCNSSCRKGESFTLDYSATLPAHTESLGGLAYRLHMVGVIE